MNKICYTGRSGAFFNVATWRHESSGTYNNSNHLWPPASKKDREGEDGLAFSRITNANKKVKKITCPQQKATKMYLPTETNLPLPSYVCSLQNDPQAASIRSYSSCHIVVLLVWDATIQLQNKKTSAFQLVIHIFLLKFSKVLQYQKYKEAPRKHYPVKVLCRKPLDRHL